jgi:hypothetical protein
VDLRADYLRLRSGAKVHKRRRLEVQAAIKEILEDAGLWDEDMDEQEEAILA